jgi:hypothetical protein
MTVQMRKLWHSVGLLILESVRSGMACSNFPQN